MLPPVIVGLGNADDFLSDLSPAPLDVESPPPRLLVAAFRVVFAIRKSKDHGRAAAWELAQETVDAIGDTDAASAAIVLDASTVRNPCLRRRAKRLANALVNEISVMSSITAGRDITVLGVVIHDPDDREVVSRRLREFAEHPVRTGDKIVLSAASLRSSSIRTLLSEMLL